MSRWAWIDPRIDGVTVAGAKAYLLDHGWCPRPFPRPEVLVFEGPLADDGTPIVLILPGSDIFVDYRMRMEELIGALGAIENRPAVEILTEMLALPRTNGAIEHLVSETIESNGR